MAFWLIPAFRAQNLSFQLSKHDVCRFHEKFSSRRYEQPYGCSAHFDLLSPETFHSNFLDMM